MKTIIYSFYFIAIAMLLQSTGARAQINRADNRNKPMEARAAFPKWVMPKPRNLSTSLFSQITSASIQGIEVTQTIQSMSATDATKDQLVSVLADRKTYVRVYTNIISTEGYGMLTGEITITSGSTTVTIPADQSISLLQSWNDSLDLKRKWITLSLNFPVPASLVKKNAVLNIRVNQLSDKYNGGASIPCTNCATKTRSVTVMESAPLRLQVIGLRYSKGGSSYQPRQLDFDLIGTWLRRAYPIASLSYQYRTVDSNNPADFDCGQANAQVAAIRALDVGNGTDARTHYYGLVYDGGFFMRGCAAVPSTPNPAAIGSGPTGSNTWGWDNDGSYGDWYTGHELGHTLGRSHVGGTCGEGGIDPNYPFPNGQLSGPNQWYVGFDVGDPNYSNIPMDAYPGLIWHDVMSYCSYQWLSSYTYDGIKTRVIAENAMSPGAAGKLMLAGRSASQQFQTIIGLVNFTSGSGKITSVHTTVNSVNKEIPKQSAYQLNLYDRSNKLISTVPVEVMRQEGLDGELETGLFQVSIPLNTSVARIELSSGSKVLDKRSSDLLILDTKSLGKSIVMLTKENAGAWLAKWGAPAYKAEVSYDIQVSPDSGYSWTTIAIGQKGNSYTISPEAYAGYRSIMVRVIINDGLHSVSLFSETIAL